MFVATVTDPTGTTMDDYYFMVNSVYIIPEKIGLDYDVDTKAASINGSISDYNGVMLVGACNEKGKLLKLDVSGSGDKEFTADFGDLDLTTVKEYKVFALNSFAECKPIMANYTMLNPAYVAPAE